MSANGVSVAACGMVTALGDTESTWAALLAGQTALAPDPRFYPSDAAKCYPVGVVLPPDKGGAQASRQAEQIRLAETASPHLFGQGRSRFMRLLSLLPLSDVPSDAKLILATTVGEIDLLEKDLTTNQHNPLASDVSNHEPHEPSRTEKIENVRDGSCGSWLENKITVLRKWWKNEPKPGTPQDTLAHVRNALGLTRPGLLLSAACASSTSALATAAQWIASGRESCVLVLGCDALSEFVYSGFLSLQALSSGCSKPFAPDRDGLNLGEGAGFMLLMSDERVRKENRARLGGIAGWGSYCDAYHATTPDPEGKGLVRAIREARQRWGEAVLGEPKTNHTQASVRLAGDGIAPPANITFICAHGTATPFNDAMEEHAFATAFNGNPPPLFSVKGAIGHTLGAAGVIEAIVCLLALHDQRIPPTAGNAALPHGAVAGHSALTTNSGFGGINTALILSS